MADDNAETEKKLYQTRYLFGRTPIYSDAKEITEDNVKSVIDKAMAIHTQNAVDIDFLDRYARGDQPIIHRVKEVRPEINNKVVVNRAKEIVSFKKGYIYGEPIQYINRKGDSSVSDDINLLNEFMFSENKAAEDEEIGEWLLTCGVAYRLLLPSDDEEEDEDDNESPFHIYTLDPRTTFLVYSTDIKHRVLMGVMYWVDENGNPHFNAYTKDRLYQIDEKGAVTSYPHMLNMIPIFEYPANRSRMGAFEAVIPILDAINRIQSNRLDGVEQIVQAFIKFINCEISESEYEDFLRKGAIKVKSVDGQQADVGVVSTTLDQNQTQTLINDLWSEALEICSMPNRNGGSSTSDTGAAVIMRDGWSDAEADAKNIEQMHKKAEKKFLKLVLAICRDSDKCPNFDLKLSDVDIKFTRRNYENVQTKANVLTTMLKEPKIHPQLAFQTSGLFSDPDTAYTESMDYYKTHKEESNVPSHTEPIPNDSQE